MKKKFNLNETWKLCLSMWRWIAKQKREGSRKYVESLKKEWLRKEGFSLNEIPSCCFFCHYTIGEGCWKCPGHKIDCNFGCCTDEYHYRYKPIAFYNKLVSLNRKRQKKK